VSSPDGALVAEFRGADLVVSRGGSVVTRRPMPFSPRALAWSPSGASIAVETANQDGVVAIDVYDPVDGGPPERVATVPAPHENGWNCFSWMEGPE
jgi:hypothetical protein